jgi:hypothetical protein
MKREQQFFDDRVVDRLMGVVMALAAEVYILKDRERVLEQLLVSNGVIAHDAVESFPEQSISGKERDAFVGRIFESIVAGGEAMSAVDLELVSSLTNRPQA